MLIEDGCQWKTSVVLSGARKGVVEGFGPSILRRCRERACEGISPAEIGRLKGFAPVPAEDHHHA